MASGLIKRLTKKETFTSTTGATGNIAVGHADSTILASYTNGYITLPFMSGDQWFIKVLSYSTLQPVANTEVTYTLEVM